MQILNSLGSSKVDFIGQLTKFTMQAYYKITYDERNVDWFCMLAGTKPYLGACAGVSVSI